MEITPESIREFVINEIFVIPELSNYTDNLNVYLTGSRATDGYSGKSDIDLDIVCKQDIYDKIRSVIPTFYSLADSNFRSYFGDIRIPHFSVSPQEKILAKLKNFDEVHMWIWGNAKLIIDNGISSVFDKSLFVFPQDVLIEKLKKIYMDFLYSIIDAYPNSDTSNDMKHIAVNSIYNALLSIYRFSYLAEKQPFPYTEKLVTHVKTKKLYMKFADTFKEIYILLENISGDGAWERIEKCRGMLCYDDKYECSDELGEYMDNVMLEAGCEKDWVEAGYDNIDDYLLSPHSIY
ncbi:MAG: hypothetical protein FWF15_03675 [Oscillospiraceae bacterium]|nr:hypothetical protein [Oscillospiraceae bacterium]